MDTQNYEVVVNPGSIELGVTTQNNILTDNEVAEGLVLSCQAEPTSTTIKVDFDDI